MTFENPISVYSCQNNDKSVCPQGIEHQAICSHEAIENILKMIPTLQKFF